MKGGRLIKTVDKYINRMYTVSRKRQDLKRLCLRTKSYQNDRTLARAVILLLWRGLSIK